MKITIFGVITAAILLGGAGSFAVPPRFEKVSGHCYYLQLAAGNVAVVVTDDGVLMVNPPRESNIQTVDEALKKITSKPVRWLAFTDHRYARTSGARYYATQGVQLLATLRLHDLSALPLRDEPQAGGQTSTRSGDALSGDLRSSAWMVFDKQMRLYPSELEVRLVAVRQKARTAGDMVVYVPAEKVLLVGDLYESARYPDIDVASEGSALGWIEGISQVINSIPVLKSAIPREKAGIKSKQEKTLEEDVLVVSAHDRVSNLQNVKDLLEGSQKLRNEISKAIRAGRSCDRFLSLPVSDPYRSYGNLAPYAQQLFQAIAAGTESNN